ncbi:unnamed protein product [Caenorhabditis nigoni]|uniref:Uncharacterized protein n=1 Tax=Caenorhabditis nigoni TaxID=1611254 RepID=A0A2G5VFT1_9PELO|nr:hypothetical protein B9Z55_000146 [Caenorhabditis nigoni]
MLSTIPDAERKLSYDCLKCVIRQFEANFRFRLAERLPKISFAEKAAPLYISNLRFTEEEFQLNDTEYCLGVVCQARDGPTPVLIKNLNRRGGSTKDLDRFGFWNHSPPELTPGDILIYDPEIDMDYDLEVDIELAEGRVLSAQKRLTDLERQKMELEYALEVFGDVPENPLEAIPAEDDLVHPEDQGLSRRGRIKTINNMIQREKDVMEYEEFDLHCLKCKRDNRSSPYEMFIKLTKTSPDGNVYTERFNYDKSLKEARKYLICKFLGNRPVVPKIKSLCIWSEPGEGLVIGLPVGIKLDVQEFGTSRNLSEVLQRVETILEHPNRPFATLKSFSLRLEDVQNPKVGNAGVLMLMDNSALDYVTLCREAPNKEIVIPDGLELQAGDYLLIVENLIDKKGTLGTSYEIIISGEDTMREALGLIAQRFENAVRGERFVYIPISQQLKLVVFYKPRVNFRDPNFGLCSVVMKVVQSRNN